ncbi:MAG: acyl-CoA dehydrogenase family protein [Stellaceae bacterium]
MTSEEFVVRPNFDPLAGAPGPDLGILARATELIPLLREESEPSEEQRRLTDRMVRALDEVGLLNIMVPRRFGGPSANIRTLVELIAEVGRGDGSAGWVTGLVNVCEWFATLYCDRAQQEIFGANPKARLCGSIFAPKGGIEKVDGGLIVSGAWPYCSGSAWADWATLALWADERPDGSPILSLGLVPMKELGHRDTWHVTGMKATVSTTLVADTIFIPDYRIQLLEQLGAERYATEYTEEPNSRASFIPVAILILAGVQIGLARHAIEYTLNRRASRPVTYTRYHEGRLAPHMQVALAEAASLTDQAHLLAIRACADIDAAALRREPLAVMTRARIRMDTSQIAELSRKAIGKLMTANGASAFATPNNPLQRLWRDSEIAARHAQVEPEVVKLTYGEAMFGLDQFSLLFF